jgi:RimJ/RimL family protein N-acetyltransferase
MIQLRPFSASEFDLFISWITSKELLLTIAGNVLTYPLTHEQLQQYLDDPKSISFNIVDANSNKVIGHAELIPGENKMIKIDKLLIGDPSARGKGIGQQVIKELLRYAFDILKMDIVELNVFDWNIAGIRCYEKCGFVANPSKQQQFRVGDKIWIAFNMTKQKVS